MPMPYLARPKGLANQHPEAWRLDLLHSSYISIFSGYTDMALGLGRDDWPQFAAKLRFPIQGHRRSRFLAALAYYPEPLAARFPLYPWRQSQKGRVKQYVNLFLTMLIGGAWHGAG